MIGGVRQEEWIRPGAVLLVGCMLAGTLPFGCDREPAAEGPPEAESRAGYNPVRFDEGLLAIETWLEDGRPEEAERIARRLVELNPNSIDALEAHGRCLVILAAMERREGRGDGLARDQEALRRYRAVIRESGETPLPAHLHAAGVAAQVAGEPEEALGYHVRADGREPDNPQHAIFSGNILAGLDRSEEAADWFTRATRIDSREPWGWAGLAEVHRQAEAWEEALVMIRKARSAAPGNSGFRVGEARILRESGRPEEAARLLFALQPEQRTTSAVTRELTASCTLLGAHRKAAEAWTALHLKEPDRFEPALEASSAWLDAGERELASSWLQTAELAGAPTERVELIRARLREADQPR
jgi:tetratricopeptide (TPR) repeat protein